MVDVNATISASLRREEQLARAAHTPSGKLSASILYKPLLEQVLKVIGVPEKPFDDYALRLFARGHQVEQWVVSHLEGEDQVEVNYRDTVGFIDKVLEDGEVVEVKSIKRSQMKWLKKEGVRTGHALQATLYALARERDGFTVIYVCADDFETMTFRLPVTHYQEQVDEIINQVKSTIKSGVLPEFEAREPWQSKPEYASKYSSFPDFVGLPVDVMMQKLENQFPASYAKLKGVKVESHASVPQV